MPVDFGRDGELCQGENVVFRLHGARCLTQCQLPTERADDQARKMGCAECCDCRCHCAFANPDGSDREDAETLRAEICRLNLESVVILEMSARRESSIEATPKSVTPLTPHPRWHTTHCSLCCE